jgi:hypothetical protein
MPKELTYEDLEPALLAAGKLALAANFVSNSQARNLSGWIEYLNEALEAYNKEIMLLEEKKKE